MPRKVREGEPEEAEKRGVYVKPGVPSVYYLLVNLVQLENTSKSVNRLK